MRVGTEQGVDAGVVSIMKGVEAPDRGAVRHVMLMVGSSVLVALLNYGLNIFLGWALSIEEYGRVGVAQTFIFLLVWFISAGFPWVVTRAVAQARSGASGGQGEQSGQGSEAHAWRVYKTAWLANLALSVVIVAAFLAAYSLGLLPLGAGYAPLVVLVALTVGALGVGSVANAGLQGLLRFERISAVRIVEAATNIVVSVALVVLGFGAAGALGGFAVAAGLVCVLNNWLMRDKPFWRTRGWAGLDTVRGALPMTMAVFGGALLMNIDLLAIKFLSPPGSSDLLSGGYQVAAVLARAPLFVGTALVSTYFPRISHETGGPNEGKSARELLRWLAVGVLPMNVVMVAAAPAVVLFFFPERYADSALSLAILGLGSGCLVVASGIAAVLQGLHRARVPALVMSGAVGVQLVGLWWVVPAMGGPGAALASAGASAMACALLGWYCWRADFGGPGGAPIVDFGLVGGRWVGLLVGLALVVVPLGQVFAGANRIFVAVWVAAALILYAAGCWALFRREL